METKTLYFFLIDGIRILVPGFPKEKNWYNSVYIRCGIPFFEFKDFVINVEKVEQIKESD